MLEQVFDEQCSVVPSRESGRRVHGDAQPGVEGQRALGKAGHGGRTLIGMDLQIRHPGAVVHGQVQKS